jgi:hypothetical protein
MTRLDEDTIKAAWRHFEKVQVFSIEDLASVLKCSIPNSRLKLKLWRTFTSYNQNGRFYALPQVPKFDNHGLWRYKDVAFSKHGNLKKTIIHLVSVAPVGLSGRQLGELLGLLPQSFLHHFRNCPGIRREKHDGVFVYFSDNDDVHEKQVQQRRSLICRPVVVTITDPEAVMILVAIIRHHGISAEEIWVLPEIKRSKMKLVNIQGFLEYHGLVKKTPDSRL